MNFYVKGQKGEKAPPRRGRLFSLLFNYNSLSVMTRLAELVVQPKRGASSHRPSVQAPTGAR